MDEHPDFGFAGPGPQDMASGTAILASALAREAQSLAQTAAGLRATLDVVADEDHRVMAAGIRGAAVLAGALVQVSRALLRCTGDPARAAGEALGRLPQGSLSVHEVVGHLRAAALAPVTDDGAARIAAAMIAETFAAAFEAAWRDALGRKGN